jgi:hypothetical protein
LRSTIETITQKFCLHHVTNWRLEISAGLRCDLLRGPGGYHQMDVMGEALEIDQKPCSVLQKKRKWAPMMPE